MDYHSAISELSRARDRSAGRPVANNTRLIQCGDEIRVVLHGTPVVTLHPDDSVTLNSGGWRTVTTKARINEFQSLARVWSTRGTWNAYVGDKEIPFADGMRIYPDGRVESAKPAKEFE